MLPPKVIEKLADPVYRRRTGDPAAAFASLGCVPGPVFAAFYDRYSGPFASEATGVELLDPVSDAVNIVTETLACREAHGFPDRYLVISSLLGGAVLVYDCDSDAVYDVDFEGGDRALMAGELEPTWPTFADFLEDYVA